MTEKGLKGKDGVEIPKEIAEATSAKYREVFQKLTGKKLEEVL